MAPPVCTRCIPDGPVLVNKSANHTLSGSPSFGDWVISLWCCWASVPLWLLEKEQAATIFVSGHMVHRLESRAPLWKTLHTEKTFVHQLWTYLWRHVKQTSCFLSVCLFVVAVTAVSGGCSSGGGLVVMLTCFCWLSGLQASVGLFTSHISGLTWNPSSGPPLAVAVPPVHPEWTGGWPVAWTDHRVDLRLVTESLQSLVPL